MNRAVRRLSIACLGSTFVVMMGSIDLSVGAIVILTGAIGVRIMNSYGLGLSILPIAALIGGALGLFAWRAPTLKGGAAFDTVRPRASITSVLIRSPGWGGFFIGIVVLV